MTPLQVSTVCLGCLLVGMTGVWWLSLRRRDVGIVDVFWGPGFALVAWLSIALAGSISLRSLTAAVLTTAWGLRLAVHLWLRNHGRPEDRRYAAMRARHGARFRWISLFTVFLLQAVVLWFVSFPVQAVATTSQVRALNVLDALGVTLWAVGFGFESIADRQLARFLADPRHRGRVLDRGLWRYTRHPNYFGDFCVWWGLYAIAAAGGAAWTVFGPLLMSWLLLRVSGVTLLEREIGARRPEYAEYQARTNAFFPGPRRTPRR